jgi:hypothetical protein
MGADSPEPSGGDTKRWNTDENPSVDGDQFLFVAAVNFVVRTFRKARANLGHKAPD